MPMKNPSHPGELIKGAMDELDLSVAQTAQALGVSRNQLNRVVTGRSGISSEMALRLEAVIGSTADAWVRMQAAYDLAKIRTRETEIKKGLQRLQPAQ